MAERGAAATTKMMQKPYGTGYLSKALAPGICQAPIDGITLRTRLHALNAVKDQICTGCSESYATVKQIIYECSLSVWKRKMEFGREVVQIYFQPLLTFLAIHVWGLRLNIVTCTPGSHSPLV